MESNQPKYNQKFNSQHNYNNINNHNNLNKIRQYIIITRMTIVKIITIITIIRIIIYFQCRVHCRHEGRVKWFGPVLVCAVPVVEKRSKTSSYQTESGETMKAPLSIPMSQVAQETRKQVTPPLVSCSTARPKRIYLKHKNGVYVQALYHNSSANNKKYMLQQGRHRWRRCMRRRNIRCWRCARA
jgi:hypothetical protein